ncbi:MAG: branched-chain amino acid ABC transporter permease [Actinobacteria bacterium]|jgi:neutral amino acid transport system permease protein|nr:branched-chain amino acid ABC transporter permease [Actinomycetota bacterium]NDF23520.1 branched-chain amino acid ABC transporter permease [Actinomycetota bacterium]
MPRWGRRSAVAFLGVVLGLGAAAPAMAQVSDDLGVIGQLQYTDAAGNKVFVADVDVSIDDVGGATTDADGSFRIPVPGPGEYTIRLDIATLPDGVALKDPERATLQAKVSENADQRVIFPLVFGDGGAQGAESNFSVRRISQLTLEGIKLGLYLAMAAIGLSLIFGTTGLVNFAHAELITWGTLMAYFFNIYGLVATFGFLSALPPPFGGGVNFVFATLLATIMGGVLGYVLNRVVFRTARNAGVSLLAQMVMTIGLSILLRYVFVYYFGSRYRVYKDYAAQRANEFLGMELTSRDATAMAVSVVILIAVGLGLTRTRTGRAMRAVSDNKDLAESSGINVERVISQVWIYGGALAALSGTFFGFDTVKWDLGTRILLLVFAAITLGGLGTAFGALVGALIVGVVINWSTLFIDTELKNMTALIVLILALLLRPQGILGKKQRIG